MLSGLLALLLAVAPSPQTAAAPPPGSPPPLDRAIGPSTRLLVVAPHPDDEALGAAGLIQRVRERGGSVRIVMMTSGDGFPEGVEAAERITNPKPSDYRNYGVLREGETRAAMQLLGIAPTHVTFLGYPDEGLCHLASTYLFDKRRSFHSPYSERDSPPPTERLVRGASYRGVDIRRELENIIIGYAPTLIVLPHPDDDHPDHCSTHIFVREALEAVPPLYSRHLRILHYLVHYEQWPLSEDAGTGSKLNPPADLPTTEGQFVSLELTPDESAAKKKALLLYTSQMQVIGRFMTAFGRDNELFIDGDSTSVPECWCDGENVAIRTPAKERRQQQRK